MKDTTKCSLITLAGLAAVVCYALINRMPDPPAAPPNKAAPIRSGELGVGSGEQEPPASGRMTEPPASAAPGPMGYVPNPEGTKKFLRTLDKPMFRQAAPGLIKNRGPPEDREAVLLYRALYEINPAWKVSYQKIGDCVSHGWAHGCDTLLAVDKKLGKSSEWHAAATEAIYGGSRVEARGRSTGGWSDGSYGGAAAKWVSKWGVVFRQLYSGDGGHDLSTYDPKRAKSWGNYGCGGQGDNGRLDAICKQHPVTTVAVVENFTEAAAAIENGYPIPVCSNQGFSSKRDAQGFARASGSWSHCMCFVGVRYDRPGLLCLNSWGTSWIGGPKWPADQPDGSFWVEASVATRMLRGGDSFAVSNYQGFKPRKLKHSDGWGALPPGGNNDETLIARTDPRRGGRERVRARTVGSAAGKGGGGLAGRGRSDPRAVARAELRRGPGQRDAPRAEAQRRLVSRQGLGAGD